MARPCGPCQDKRRNELDRRLLEMDLTGETIAGIAREWGYSEDSMRRHKANHVIKPLGDVRALMVEAREAALSEIKEEVRAEELEGLRDGLKDTIKADIANRLELAKDPIDQLKILRERAAIALEKAEGSENHKIALQAIRELRELVRLWGELEGKLQFQPQINLQQVNIYQSPAWANVGLLLARILEPYPSLRTEVAAGLIALQEGQDGA